MLGLEVALQMRDEMRILLADDQPMVRLALRLLMEQELGVQVVGEAADMQSLATRVQADTVDLVLLDWELPGLHDAGAGQANLLGLRRAQPRLAVIALSARPEARAAALAAGADGFVSKGDPPDHLLAALRALGHPQSAGRV